jgi:DHA2 family methylenomycin A resistance protein-like MFS transporter
VGADPTRQRLVLVAASLAVGLAFLDETAVVTALRTIQADLDMSSPTLQWVMGAYLLALASLMAAAGRLADLYGRRRTFLVGTGLFFLGTLVCVVAPTAVALVVGRGVQGVGAALLVPLGYANATLAVPEDRRGWALGIVSTGATVFLAAGPLIGGLLTQTLGWRWVFGINLVPLLVIAVIAVRWMPESRADRREPLDVLGLVLLVCGLTALTTALLQVQSSGWAFTAIVLLVSVVALIAFLLVERRSPAPLVELRLLRIPAVAGSLAALFAYQFSILGLTVYLTLYLQHLLGYGPVVAGVLTLPAVVLAPFLSGWVGRRTDRRGTRGLTLSGLLLATLSVFVIGLAADARAILTLMVPLLVFGVARPAATIAGTAGTVGAIRARSRGLASALATQSRQLGAVLGVAVLGLVVTATEHHTRTQLLHTVDAGFDRADRKALDALLAGGDEADSLLAALSPDQRTAALDAAADAYVHGFSVAMFVVTAVLLVASAVGWLLIPRRNEPRHTWTSRVRRALG